MASGSLRLISGDYSLAAGQEKFLCQRLTVQSDLYITRITPVNGLATHHEVLGIDTTPGQPDGQADCSGNIEFDVLKWKLLFASGVNSPGLTMPAGVALKVAAGQQLVFQMHVLNASQSAVTSSASIDVRTLPPGAPTPIEAQMILAGPLPDHRVTPDIPVGVQVIKGTCTLKADSHYFAVFPHMHQIGTHIAVAATVGGAAQTLYDADYSFNNQDFKEFPPVAMAQGDQVGVACTYDNQTGMPVQFGQSSYNEMCFAISYFYPPLPTSVLGDFCSS
jgi:Copper type II ascorbate-dependent monooxygenase, C-terminal domain